jgi:RNA polymerase sigma factor (sigma-70 family)
MKPSALSEFLHGLRLRMAHSVLAGDSDSLLLERFHRQGDDTAFAVLVQRHGPMVLGVCRRVLSNEHEAEDAFQATFLVLVRKAGAIRKRESLASWLHGVAQRIAIKSQRRSVRRRGVEEKAARHVEHSAMDSANWDELRTVLDEEIQRLPTKLRVPFILCHLQRKTHAQIATELRLGRSSISERLAQASEMLCKRLTKRGVQVSVAALAALFTEKSVSAALPAGLMVATVKLATLWAAGKTALAGGVSASAITLAKEALKGMIATKVKLILLTMSVGLALAGVGVAGYRGIGSADVAEGDKGQRRYTQSSARVASKQHEPEKKENRVDFYGDPLPEGAVARLGTVRWRHDGLVEFAAYLGEGSKIASAATDRFARIWDRATGKEIRRFGPGPRTELPFLSAKAGGIGSFWSKTEQPNRVAVSADGTHLAAGFEPQVVEVWEITTGRKIATIKSEDKFGSRAIAFAPDGEHLAVAGISGTVALWNVKSCSIVREFGKRDKSFDPKRDSTELEGILFATNGDTLVTVASESTFRDGKPYYFRRLRFWNPWKGEERYSLQQPHIPGERLALAFSPDSKLFAFATRASEIILLQVANGEQLHKLKVTEQHADTLLAFNPEGAKLYSRSLITSLNDLIIQEWDTHSGKLLRRFGERDPDLGRWSIVNMQLGRSLQVSPDGKTLLTGEGSNTLHFFDLLAGKVQPFDDGHSHRVVAISYLPDSKSVISRGYDSTLQVWDTATGRSNRRLSQLLEEGKAVTVDGRYLAASDYKKHITLFDSSVGKVVASIPLFQERSVEEFFFSPDGRVLLHFKPRVPEALLFDTASGKQRSRVALPNNGKPQTPATATLFFSADGGRLAVYAYTLPRSLAIHDTKTGKLLQRLLEDPEVGIVGAAFSPDGRSLALDHGDGQIQLVEMATGKYRKVFGTPYINRAKPKEVSGMTWSSTTLWNGEAASSTVAFSPDGRLLAHADQQELKVWEVITGETLAKFKGHTGKLTAVAYAPDGATIASASQDTTGLIWNVRSLSSKADMPTSPLDADALGVYWTDLLSDDAADAYAAMNTLIAANAQAVTFLKARFQSTPDESLVGESLRQLRAIEVLERIGNGEAREVLSGLAAGAPEAISTREARAAMGRITQVPWPSRR